MFFLLSCSPTKNYIESWSSWSTKHPIDSCGEGRSKCSIKMPSCRRYPDYCKMDKGIDGICHLLSDLNMYYSAVFIIQKSIINFFWEFCASSNEHTTKATTSIFLCQTRDFNTQMIGIIWSASKHREGRLWVKGGEGLWLISLVVSAAMMEVRESMKITT